MQISLQELLEDQTNTKKPSLSVNDDIGANQHGDHGDGHISC